MTVPIWLILALAAAIVVVGVGVPTLLRTRRTRAGALTTALRAARAHAEQLRYLIDTSDPDLDPAEASRLCDTAEATLATAQDHRSAAACARAERLLDQAEAELRLAPSTSPDRPDPS